LLIILASLIGFLPRFFKNDGIKILLLLLLSPVIGMLFFQGNKGNIYDYYMTGYYMIFLLLFGIILGELWKNAAGKIFILIFFWIFFANNLPIVKARIISGVDGETTIALGNQVQAVEWVYEDAAGRDFNVDVYVPPVIPHSYDYLFTWLGSNRYNQLPTEEQIELLYTLSEVDPPHPERLEAWFARQKGIGNIEETKHFGGITVERRERIYREHEQ
jgi:hypothetical protein